MRLSLSLLASLLFCAACGGTTSAGAPDSGAADASCGPPSPLHCAGPCGEVGEASCVDGSWQCPVFSGACAADAGTADADATDAGAPDAETTTDASIACNGLTCNAATQYCDIRGGGVQLPDAGSNFSVRCLALPAMPCEAGTGCACIPDTCSCTDDGGAIKNECLYP